MKIAGVSVNLLAISISATSSAPLNEIAILGHSLLASWIMSAGLLLLRRVFSSSISSAVVIRVFAARGYPEIEVRHILGYLLSLVKCRRRRHLQSFNYPS